MPISIKTRLLIGYFGGLILIIGVAATALYDRSILIHGIKDAESITEEIATVQDLNMVLEGLVISVTDYMSTGKPVGREYLLDTGKKMDEPFKRIKALHVYRNHAGAAESGKQDAVEEMQTSLHNIRKLAENIYVIQHPQKSAEATRLFSEIEKERKNFLRQLQTYNSLNKEEQEYALYLSERHIKTVNITMASGAMLVLFFALTYILYLNRTIADPIINLTESVKEVEAGRWEKIAPQGGKELDLLVNEYNRMIDRLHDSYEGLEEIVVLRTAELREANTEIRKRYEELKELQQVTRELAITDGLTGLYNHKQLWERLEDEIARAERFGNPLSFIMCDIDYFKHYNDNNGHLKGDKLLKELGTILKSSMRKIDIVARYGGEEFGIILIETGKDDAYKVAEKLRGTVEAFHFENEEGQPDGDVTLSLGLASYPVDSTNCEELVRMADEALYTAKRQGRNRVRVKGIS